MTEDAESFCSENNVIDMKSLTSSESSISISVLISELELSDLTRLSMDFWPRKLMNSASQKMKSRDTLIALNYEWYTWCISVDSESIR